MRHLNVSKRVAVNNSDSDEFDQNEEDIQQVEKKQSTTVAVDKPPMPSFSKKTKIRGQMFSFLDDARMEEMRLVPFIYVDNFH
jgi:hypothetical protein